VGFRFKDLTIFPTNQLHDLGQVTNLLLFKLFCIKMGIKFASFLEVSRLR
jgi:hypothetical protein